MAQQEQELEFIGDFDPEEEEDSEQEDQNIRYIFDPDTQQDEQIEYDPKRRRKTKTRWRTRTKTRIKRVYARAKKRKKPAWIGWQTAIAIPIAITSFLISMQQDTLGWFADHDPANITRSFSIFELLKTLSGGWGRPEGIMAYLKNILASPLGLGGIALAVYALLPIKGLPLKRIALICGGALVIGSILGSALHASGEEKSNSNSSGSGSGTRTSNIQLDSSPFNR